MTALRFVAVMASTSVGAMVLFAGVVLLVTWGLHRRRRYDLVADACAERIYQASRRGQR